MKPRENPEVFEWVTDFIQFLEYIEEHAWAEQLREAVKIREEQRALHQLHSILQSYYKKEKPKYRRHNPYFVLLYFDWIFVPEGFQGKFRKIGRNFINNLIVWIIMSALGISIYSEQVSEGFLLALLVCVSGVWIYEYISAFRNPPIYRNYLHLAGIAVALLGVVIAIVGGKSIRLWVIFGLAGYAVGVLSSSIFSVRRPRLKNIL